MYFALCRCEIFIPQAHSLKAKRSVINRAKERLRARFRVSAAEVDLQDLWQRGVLGIALVGRKPAALEAGLAAMRRMIEDDPRLEVIAWEIRIEPFAGAPARCPECPAEDDLSSDWQAAAEDDELFGPGWDRERPSEGGE